MNTSSFLPLLKKPFVGTIWMWLIGSFLSQIVLLVIAPQDYRNGWFFYLFMTLAFSEAGLVGASYMLLTDDKNTRNTRL